MLKYLYEPFKKWSDGGQVWIYSDPHFEDNDCKIMSADWPTPQEQVTKINSKVGRNDTIIILGDIGNPEYKFLHKDIFHTNKYEKIFSQ